MLTKEKESDIHAENPVFSIFSNSTGIKYNKIGFFRFFSKTESHFHKHSLNFFTIRKIKLTAITMNTSRHRIITLSDFFRNKRNVFVKT